MNECVVYVFEEETYNILKTEDILKLFHENSLKYKKSVLYKHDAEYPADTC